MDALLGAAAMGDIGKHFPDTDPLYKGADSMMLLKHVRRLIEGKGYFIENVDATIIAQRPKLAPYIPDMKKNIASVLQIAPDQVNVKATTEEGLGFTGEGLGIAANAVCLLSEIRNYIGIDIMDEERGLTDCEGCLGCKRAFTEPLNQDCVKPDKAVEI
jgi:2-C-methyl-D-erythritol 2,4-cyclodiphosphate synthase